MDSESRKVTVTLDAAIVADVRQAVEPSVGTDAAAVERALNAYLLGRLVDTTQARSDRSAADAERKAYDELWAARREREGNDTLERPERSSQVASATELVRGMRERNAPRRAAVLRHVAALRRIAERLRKGPR